jgi:putative ABC transport system substrate-binding protein
MKRSAVAFLLVVLFALPLIAEPQSAGRVYRIAHVHPAMAVGHMLGHYNIVFSELRRLGYVEGQNLVVERRSAEGRPERYAELARAILQLPPDLILTHSTSLVGTFKAATNRVPIVGFTGLDPVAAGLVDSLMRPGGNVTGFTVSASDEIVGKHLELLREAVPTASRVAFLAPQSVWETRYGRVMREAAVRTGMKLVEASLRSPIQEPEYRRAFAAMVRDRVEILVVGDSPENIAHRRIVLELAAEARLPAIYPYRDFVEAGGLMAYATDIAAMYRRAAGYIARILAGANPGDLPYQQPTRFELIVNLKTAKALGLTIPPSVLLRADEVIQ